MFLNSQWKSPLDHLFQPWLIEIDHWTTCTVRCVVWLYNVELISSDKKTFPPLSITERSYTGQLNARLVSICMAV